MAYVKKHTNIFNRSEAFNFFHCAISVEIR